MRFFLYLLTKKKNISFVTLRDFCTRFAAHLPAAYIENIDLSNNAFEDKGRFMTSFDCRDLLLRINFDNMNWNPH